jgi:hypothetical protein
MKKKIIELFNLIHSIFIYKGGYSSKSAVYASINTMIAISSIILFIMTLPIIICFDLPWYSFLLITGFCLFLDVIFFTINRKTKIKNILKKSPF